MSRMWGVEVERRTIRQMPFVCPRCGVDRIGREVEPQRWFVVARVKLVPLATLAREIECATCARRSDLGVLDVPTTEQLQHFLDLANRSAAAMVVRAGTSGDAAQIDAKVVDATISIMANDGIAYDAARLAEDLAELDDGCVRRSLQRLSPELTHYGKQGFLHRMAAIAVADGPIDEREQRALIALGAALGMSAPHINGVLAVAEMMPEAA